MVALTTRLMTMLTGTLVGRDADGNAYYRGKSRAGQTAPRRWVLYRGEVEATRVPPHWHAWLHYMVDGPPLAPPETHKWQAPHQANLTGTAAAYRPGGSATRDGKRPASTSEYEPWTPN